MTRRRIHPNGDSAADRLALQIAQTFGAGTGRALSRRTVLRGAGVSALALSSTGWLTACGTEGTVQTKDECKSTDKSDTEKTLNWSNWPLYIDEKGKKYPTLEDFQKQTGIKVTYTTDVNDNNEFFAKVRNQLGACDSTGRDIFVLTDWMAARVISLGWTQELDHANMPNVDANLVESLSNPAWDEGRKHSVPWQSGLTGIAYNAKYTGEVTSFEELLTRPDLKGKISLLSEMGDTMGFMLKLTGADPAKFSEDEWQAALDKMQQVVDSGQVRQFTGNDYTRPLNKGDIVACEAWSGDVIAMQYDNPDIKFVLPEEGTSLWSDNMMVPNKSEHKTNAEKLMNYYYDPEVAARLAAWVNYICPVQGAEEAMASIDESLVGNPLIFPTSEDLATTFAFANVDTKTREEYDKAFNAIIGA
ncbi:spermidine/putrescine ABC transporter substrate-binding protein [Nocardioides agariphilus]|jgi:spermidine/putrescine transport system substrate-binding protein|uniref:Spermidine/putrescine ABC transporter substrate-binding protein n=1 Tax=Nocardioides agariphilus TaxID=433664 RepID=A0A930YK49_9ACTN|nr:spermidine/putrescine ABC transporter substrate-binding protein [Nocardioides agariphilus]MBF4770007.1 spermidine/putrescine ABC transporter substrate-binding protein [Nocardioides agariphilus]